MWAKKHLLPVGECKDGRKRAEGVLDNFRGADEDLPQGVAEQRADGSGRGYPEEEERVPIAGRAKEGLH